MSDEQYAFVSDVQSKGFTARSARRRKTHTGKGGRARMPHDNLTKKELEGMNGECKSYRLNEPMKWQEFKSMPDDIKITYIKMIRRKFNAPNTMIAQMMGASEITVRRELKKLGLAEGKGSRTKNTKWDKEGFYAWMHGVHQQSTTVPEESPVDRLQKANDALMERHENVFGVNEKLRLLCSEHEEKLKILEAQMEVVRMIFDNRKVEIT